MMITMDNCLDKMSSSNDLPGRNELIVEFYSSKLVLK